MDSTLLTIYGAKISKDKKKVVITLITGEEDNKRFYNACVKLDHSQKTDATIDKYGKNVCLKIPILQDKQN